MSKGGKYERDVAKRFSRWLNGGEKEPLQLWRSVMSGGWESAHLPNVADLQPVGDKGYEFRQHFCIECKHRNEIKFYHIFSSKAPDIVEWWEKVSMEAAQHDLCPLLVMKRDYHPELIGFPPGLLPLSAMDSAIHLPYEGIYITELDEFLQHEPEEIYKCVEGWKGK